MVFMFLSSFFACEKPIACNEMFVYSVNLELLDPSGSPITDAEIAYTVDGSEGEFIESWEDGIYVIGGEEAGDFVISIDAIIENPDDECCWTEGSAELSLTIEADECHVIPQSISPELEWLEVCADSEECG